MEEIERTYLVKEFPEAMHSARRKEMLDIYVPASEEHPVLRIRESGTRHEITKKQPVEGSDSSRQLETTIPLTEAEYRDLALLPGRRVRKTRFCFEEGSVGYEVDVFRDGLAGLVLADIEFDSLEKKAAFVPPSWCLAEVTQEKFLAGGMVCGKTYADLAGDLERFGYKKIEAE